MERLEDRRLLSTFSVNSFDDAVSATPLGDEQVDSGTIEWLFMDSGPTPPIDVSHTVVDSAPQSAVTLSEVPTSTWTYGCSATAAGMIFGYYDRHGYPNMYTGPTNGGVAPLTDLGQGDDPLNPIVGSCSIIATQNGFDGRISNGHVDDYWASYGSPGPDAWEGNWAEHTWEICTADFMGTNQWKWDWDIDGTKDANTDGATTLFTDDSGDKLYDHIPPASAGLPQTALCHGMRLFAESRAYAVIENYTQLTDNQHPAGFTFADYQAEIDAGCPVMIQLEGHSIVGVGYDAPDTVYVHDTWDNDVHEMTWGGSYSGMDQRAVTVTHLESSRVVDVAPDPNSHTAAVDTEVSVTYDQDIDPDSVSDQTFAVHAMQTGQLLDPPNTISVDGPTITLDPAESFYPGELVQVTATRGIKNEFGVAPARPFVWQFRTAVTAGSGVPGASGVFGDSGQKMDSSHSYAVALGDLDGDGDLDAFVGNHGEPNKVWLNGENGDPQGTFSDTWESPASSSSWAVALGDLDGDGDIDAFVGNDGPNEAWLNDGSGSFGDTYTWQSDVDSESYVVALGDVDGDGDLDALVANLDARENENRIRWNDGAGDFSQSDLLPGSFASYAAALGDLDGDHDLDVLVGDWGEPNKVWLNQGGLQGGTLGSFSNPVESGPSSYTAAVALGDVDADGDLDAFLGNWPQGNTVRLNDGSGNFSDSGQTLGGSFSWDVALGDLDGDGDLDAFVANYSYQPNTVWLNDGSGSFSDSDQRLGNSYSAAVALGDVDGDRDLDAFVGNFGSNKVWLNQNVLLEEGTVTVVGGDDIDDVFELLPGPTPGSWLVKVNGVTHQFDAEPIAVDFDGLGGGDRITLTGTGGKEALRIWPGRGKLSGEGYVVTFANVESATVNGGGGVDVAWLFDSHLADVFHASDRSGRMSGPGFDNLATDFFYVHGYASNDGQTDLARFDDAAGAPDLLRAWPGQVCLTGTGFYTRAKGFDGVEASATDPTDLAMIYDSPGPDVLDAYADRATMTYSDGTTVEADDFRWVHAYASPGAVDTANLYDTTADALTSYDATFDAQVLADGRLCSRMFTAGNGFLNRLLGFDVTRAACTPGGNDVALIHDSPGPDVFDGYADRAVMSYADGKSVEADAFRWMHAYASPGAVDRANLHDTTADGLTSYDVTFDAKVLADGRLCSRMFTAGYGFLNRVLGFEVTRVACTPGGNDVAMIYDSPQADVFDGYADRAAMSYGDGKTVEAGAFRWMHAYASPGAVDRANLHDTTADGLTSYNTTFDASVSPGGRHCSRMYTAGYGFLNRVLGFEVTRAVCTPGGNDVAMIYDSPGPDAFEAYADRGTMTYADGTVVEARDFRYLHAFSRNGGPDTATLYDRTTTGTSYVTTFRGYAESSILYTGYHSGTVRAWGFDQTRAALGGGDDGVELYDDSARVDHLVVPFPGDADHDPAKARFHNDRRQIYIDDFDWLWATTSEDLVDDADVAEEYVDEVILDGNWADA